MRQVVPLLLWCVLAMNVAAAQPAAPRRAAPRGRRTPVRDELREIKDALAAQQRQIRQLQQALDSRDRQIRRLQERLDQNQATAQQAQSQAAAAAQAAGEQSRSLAGVQSSFTEMSSSLKSTAAGAQEERKRVATLEAVARRFQFTGDIRLRYENYFQDGATTAGPGCARPPWRCTNRST